jgi:methylglutaconyl-CoA hydratase
MLTAQRIDAAEAHRIGLVHGVAEDLDGGVEAVLTALAQGGPKAHAEIKRLVRAVDGRPVDEVVMNRTAESIAGARASEEGREGVAAFLEKRTPAWRP